MVDEGSDAFRRIAFRRRRDDGVGPVERLPLAAPDVEIGGAGDAEALADHGDTVATDEGNGLFLNGGLRIHLLIGIDDDPADLARLGPQHFDIGPW